MNPRLLVIAAVMAVPIRVYAQSCDAPRPRDIGPLMKVIADDDALASTFDITAGACISESRACDDAKLKCGDELTRTLQKQVNVDDGMWLRDMLMPVLGQKYPMTVNIPGTEVAQDVSCNGDSATLKAAGARRRQKAQKRRDIINEYPKWAQWTQGVSQKCKADAAQSSKAQQDAAAIAAAQAAAAAAAKDAEQMRQDNVKKQQQAAIDKVEAEKRAKEEAARKQAEDIKRQQEAQIEAQRKQQEAQRNAIDAQAEAARKAQEERNRKAQEEADLKKREEEKRLREAQALADAKLVQDRESKKTAAERKADELKAAEDARRAAAEKQIAAIAAVDRSDERLKGSIAAQAAGGYLSLGGANAGPLLGALVSLRYGLWTTAPAVGMASGMELKANLLIGGQIGAPSNAFLLSVAPELRWYFARFGVGATFEYRRLSYAAMTESPDTITLGPNISVAMLDSPDARLIATLRYLPFVFSGFDWARVNGEVEIGFKWFTASIQAGTLTTRSAGVSTVGWFAGIGLGGRLRF